MKLVFWMFAVIILFNLNTAVAMGFDIEQLFTPLIGLLCLILIQACLHSVSLKKALGTSGFLIVATLTSYLSISCIIALITESNWNSESYNLIIGHSYSILTIIAVAVGGRAMVRQAGPESVLKAVLVLLTLDCVIILLSPILRAHFYMNTPVTGEHRLFGTFRDPNGAGFIGCLTCVLALSFFSFQQHRKFAYLALTVGIVAIIGTFSRIAFLSFIFYFVLFFVWNVGTRRFVVKWSALMILIGSIAYMTTPLKQFQLHGDQISRLKSIVSILTVRTETYDADRMEVWLLALKQILESPILGLGLGKMYQVENAPYAYAHYDHRLIKLGVHNNYLLLWGEGGIIPLALFLLFFVYFLLLSRKISNAVVRNAVFGWVLTIATFCTVHHVILLQRTVAFIIGLTCALVGFGNYTRTKQGRLQ